MSFDIGEDEDLNKKLAAKKKQLKAEGKGNRPRRADPLDENQMEKLWTTGAVGLKTPRQLLHLVWWNNTRMLGMRGRQEHLNCKVQDFKDQGNYYEYTERSTKRRTGETDDPKARHRYNNKIFQGNDDERDPYVALKKVPQPQTRGNRRIIFAADRQPERKHLVQEAAHEEGRPGKQNETNGGESRDSKRR